MKLRRIFLTVTCVVLAYYPGGRVVGQILSVAESSVTGSAGDAQPLFSETMVDLPSDAEPYDSGLFPLSYSSRWTASAEFLILERVGTVDQTLVTVYPGAPDPAGQYIVGRDVDRLHSSDLIQGFAGGPKAGLLRRGDNGYDLELSFFEIDGWENAASVASGADITPIFVAPGTPLEFVQTTDHADQFMAWRYATRLYNAELNARWNFCPRVTMLVGFRWINLTEQLVGSLPPQRQIPFWDNTTRNNLYGFQIGEDWKMLDRGRLSIDGIVKAGIFGNVADETTDVSIYQRVRRECASTTQFAFLGEVGAQCKYQLTRKFSLKAGYVAMWMQGVALAPGQIPETLSTITWPGSVEALGVSSRSGVFYHGATAGLEYTF